MEVIEDIEYDPLDEPRLDTEIWSDEDNDRLCPHNYRLDGDCPHCREVEGVLSLYE
jgi:hypothetical protein